MAVRSESKSEFNQRIHKEGRWPEFVQLRESLKKAGVRAQDAWRIAAQRFPPLDGSEVVFVDDDGKPLPPVDMPESSQPDPESAAVQPVVPLKKPGFDDLKKTKGKKKVEAAPQPEVELPPSPTPLLSPASSPLPSEIAGFILNESKQQERAYFEIAVKVPSDKKAGHVEIANWVFENALTPIELIDISGVPSRGALRLLKHVRNSDTNYAAFLQGIWSKMLPAKTQLSSGSGMNDDGRETLSLLEQFMKNQSADSEQQVAIIPSAVMEESASG